jgi:hypothetical protein
MSITTATFRNVVFRTPLVAPVIIWTTPMTFVIVVTSVIISIVWLSVMMCVWLVLRTEKTKKDLMTMIATINQSLTIDRTMQYDPTKIRDTGDHIITDNHTMDMMTEVTTITKVIGVAIIVIKSFFVFSVLRTSHTCKYHQENLQNKNKYMHHVIKMERYMQLLVGHLRRIVSVSNTSTYLNVYLLRRFKVPVVCINAMCIII